jgi:hypothetical protein
MTSNSLFIVDTLTGRGLDFTIVEPRPENYQMRPSLVV